MIFKLMLALSLIFLTTVATATGYFVFAKQVDLAIMFSMLTGAAILNCGNIYGYIVNENWVKKYGGKQ